MLLSRKHKKTMYLRAETIIKYLSGDDYLETLITANSSEYNLITSDQSLYEALGSLDRKNINFNLLVKLLEVTDIVSFYYNMGLDRRVLTEERVSELKEKLDRDNIEAQEKRGD